MEEKMEKKIFTRFGIASLVLVLMLCILPAAASAGTYITPVERDFETGQVIEQLLAVTTIEEDTTTPVGVQIQVDSEINATEHEKTVNWTYKEKDYWENQIGISGGKKDWFTAELQGKYGNETEKIYDAGTITYSPHCQLTLYKQEYLRSITYKTVYYYQIRAEDGSWINDDSYELPPAYSYEQRHYFVSSYVTNRLPCEADYSRAVQQSDGTTAYHCTFISCDQLVPAVGPHTCSYAGSSCTERTRCTVCGKYGSVLGHDYADATCTSPRKCTRCSATSGSPLGHIMGSWRTTSSSTCVSHGVEARQCIRCSYKETQPLPLTDHTCAWKTVRSATCTAAGEKRYICTYCDYVKQTESIPKLGHNYSAATCTAPQTCSRCGATSGSPLGHNYSAATCTAAKKCSRCGTTSGSALGHNYAGATCTSPRKCTRCGATSGSALGHSYAAATCTSPSRCSRCGTTSGTPLGHNWASATCTAASRCRRCGTTSGSALGHSWGSWITTRYPTAKTNGTQKRTCSRCGATETRSFR